MWESRPNVPNYLDIWSTGLLLCLDLARLMIAPDDNTDLIGYLEVKNRVFVSGKSIINSRQLEKPILGLGTTKK